MISSKQSVRSPNLFIVGAPKCGTTALAKWLAEHPSIFITSPKEPWFFNTDFGPAGPCANLAEYEHLYIEATSDHQYVGEASTAYLASSDAIPRILADYPDSKFIIMVRHPIDIVISLHNEEVRAFNEDIESIEEAWFAQSDRLMGKRVPQKCRHVDLLNYTRRASIGRQTLAASNLIPEYNLKIIFQSDMAENSAKIYSEVLDYLYLKHDERSDFGRENTYAEWRLPWLQKSLCHLSRFRQRFGIKGNLGVLPMIARLNRQQQKKPQLSEHLLNDMYEQFMPEIEAIEVATGRVLDDWK